MKSDLPLVIGTAGHVDHGKTTLIRLLTGVDTDRLAEEKRRGMTIDLGFAPFLLPSGRQAGVVDVPGHEKFLKNMLAGAGGIDLVLLVVAADDGVMPQTREHLEILSLLHVRRGLVVVTKVDLVDPELLELAIADVTDALAGTFLENAPVLPVSATTQAGIPALLEAIERAAVDLPPRAADGPARLPIDRVFVKQGFGTVVTGTLLAGTLAEGDAVVVEPGGQPSRVRGIQVHGGKRARAVAGQRVAINMAGLEKQALERGDWVLAPGTATPSRLLDVQLTLLPNAPRLAHRTRVRVHHGTAEVIGRVMLLDRDALEPGEQAKAQLSLETEVVAVFGDRCVLRLYSPARVIAGAQVLHATPARHRRNQAGTLAALDSLQAGDPVAALDQVLAHAGRRSLGEHALLGFVPAALHAEARAWLRAHAFAVEGGQYLHKGTADALAKELLDSLQAFHAKVGWRIGLEREELAKRTKLPLGVVTRVLAALEARGELRRVGRLWHSPAHVTRLPEELRQASEAVLARLQAAPLADVDDFQGLGGDRLAGLLEDLVESARIVRISGGVYAASDRLEALKQRLAERFAAGETFTASQARELLETNRKYVIPFLEYLDSVGFTRRQGDTRQVAPRR